MTTIIGTILLELINIGTKSEGIGTFIITPDEKRLQLYRPDVYPMNDTFFTPFNGLTVKTEGETEDFNYFLVHTIAILNINDKQEDVI